MKILMLTPYLPYPPASGGQIRTLNLLKYLKKNHEVTLISLYKNEKEREYAAHLSAYCSHVYPCKRPEKPWQIKNLFKSVISILPFLIVRNYSSEARETVTRLLKKEHFDVIHAETFYIMPHIPETSIPILLVEQTIEYKVYQHFLTSLPFFFSSVLQLDILKLKFWELHYWKKASVVATVSASDKKIIQSLNEKIKVTVIPNGAGDDMFVNNLPKKNIQTPTLLFVGNFSWLQNVEAAKFLIDSVFPLLKKEITNSKLIIAGQNASQKLPGQPCKDIEIITLHQDDTETVQRLYREATLFISPIFGPGGTRLKILAAMASGLPVVSTATGVEGLEVLNEQHVMIAESNNTLVAKAKKILGDEALYQKLRNNAYLLAKDKYSWNAISKKLEDVYKTI
ncbi:glycosyltransferase family 4 protein [Candidatus Roizmanbacteria bacterium]|nr:glycosyltransferase family 4 protein [Candidatus Roizmanbacteria bacterium]